MTFHLRIQFHSILVCLSALFGSAAAQDFPNRTIRIVVPFGAGTTTDQGARYIGQKMSDTLRQPVVIDNRPGGNGVIGMNAVAQAAPDGYTLVVGTSTTHAANVSLMKKIPYDPVKDFVPITGLIQGGNALVVNPNLPVKNVQELIAMAQKSPGKLTFGSGNSSSRAGGEVLKELTGVDIVYVPYTTIPAALTDTIGGQIHMVFGDALAVFPLVRAGKLKALGVTTTVRMPGYEDIPTIAEQGVPGYEVTGWLMMSAPAKTPPEIVARLNSVVVGILKSQDAREYFGKAAWITIPSSSDESALLMRKEIDKWAKLVKSANIEQQ